MYRINTQRDDFIQIALVCLFCKFNESLHCVYVSAKTLKGREIISLNKTHR